MYKPSNIIGLNQIFARDIGFVIEKFIIPNIIADRIEEVDAINHIINQFDPKNVITMPKNARAEGGDEFLVMIIFLLAIRKMTILNNIKLLELILKR